MRRERERGEFALVLVGLASTALIGGAAAATDQLGIAVLSLGAIAGHMVGLKRVDETDSTLEEARYA